MGFYSDQILPRFVNVVMGVKEFEPIRARVSSGLEGDVVEIGFGSGLNVPSYPPAVKRVLAVDPATVGRKLAAKRLAATAVPVEFVGLDGEELPVESDSVDRVLATWTLCSIPKPERALAEIYRVLRSGGEFRFVEHGLSPEPTVARWQNRITPLQRRVAGGCHLNRPVQSLLDASGLEVTRIDSYYVSGPKPWGYMYEGAATKP